MPSNHLILCHPLLLLPSIFPSIRVCSSESALHIRWAKYWSFSFNISPSNEYSGLISFVCVCVCVLVTQSCSTLCKLKDCSPPGSSVHGILQAKVLEWGAIAFSDLDTILKSRGITLPTKLRLVKAIVFPIVMCGYESWTTKKAERQRIDAFDLWCWTRLESPFDCKEIQPVNPERNQS